MRRFALPAALLFASMAAAGDWPQFRGPKRDGRSTDAGLLQSWPKDGPKLLWTFAECGVGYAGPAVVGDRLFLAGGRGNDEFVYALDLQANPPKELWSAKIGPLFTWKGNSWNAGTNVSPTTDGERVFVLGGFGDLLCVEAATGKDLWRVNLPKDLGGAVNPIGGGLEEPTPLGWGYSAAPLLDGDRVIVSVGGSKGLLAALDKTTGKTVWRSKDATDETSYSSPVFAEIGGVKQIVQVTNKGLVGVAATDGKVLWRYARAYEDVAISTPLVLGDHVYASVGFGEGCDMVKIAANGGAFTATKVYANKDVQNRDGGLILANGLVFGHSEKGGWTCQDFVTGAVKWSDPGVGRGTVSFADGRLYCVAEKGGAVALVEPSAEGWTQTGRFKLPRESKLRKPSGALWTHPVVANGKLYVRDQELLFCFDVKK
ncbi:MAG: PQQ-binding-like beta-propeller repeat protein [Gemmataceae bacterium]